MSGQPDHWERPSRDRVFVLLGYPPTSTILAESLRDGLYFALVESGDGSQKNGILFRFVNEEWVRIDENASQQIALAVGRDPFRAGSTLRIAVNDDRYEEQVSLDGWWAFAAAVEGYALPEDAIRYPEPDGPGSDHEPL